MKSVKIDIATTGERHAMINKIQTVIMNNDGFIINFNRFSDLALTLILEIEENKIIDLHKALEKITSISKLDTESFNPDSKKERSLILNITFTQGSGDLEIETNEYSE